MFFGIKEKAIILTHTMYCWLLNKPVLLLTAFVLQGHIYGFCEIFLIQSFKFSLRQTQMCFI